MSCDEEERRGIPGLNADLSLRLHYSLALAQKSLLFNHCFSHLPQDAHGLAGGGDRKYELSGAPPVHLIKMSAFESTMES
ncbi:hypothetical protein NQZ68_003905 [Dissostichus eleginoides]|nr:hypothetical protein NQZ68_003905 [Dissostichus eleginoides]